METNFNFDKQISDDIFRMYFNERIGCNSICEKCKEFSEKKNKKLLDGVVPIFHIGKDYNKNEKRILLIGMVAYGWEKLANLWESTFNENEKTLYDIQKDVENQSIVLFRKKKERYFKYLVYALTKVFNDFDTAYNNIALTNLVHCNTGSINDNLPQGVRNYCINIDQNGFVFKEIEILKPTHIIVFTKSPKYINYLNNCKYNFIAIDHPSGRYRRTKEGFADDILNFLNK